MRDIWAARADAAERAVLGRHVRRLWGLPGTRLGVVGCPPTVAERGFLRWHYWWQAHLLDACVDAFHRSPSRDRRARVARVAHAHRVRNGGRWTNDYFDDMAWLALALHRAGALAGVRHPAGVDTLTGALRDARAPSGAVPWRRGDDFHNAAATGPTAVLLARTGHLDEAAAGADWLAETLGDPATGLVHDGIRPAGLVRAHYSYCQGVALGADVELAARTGEPRHARRVTALVAAVDEHLTDDGVLRGHDGGDGGLFTGILARYLALVVAALPGTDEPARTARTTATRLVLASARALWAQRAQTEGGPVFGPDGTRTATGPTGGGGGRIDGAVRSSTVGERDLSVQLSAWLLLEAAATVAG